jgi:hypothetical protein
MFEEEGLVKHPDVVDGDSSALFLSVSHVSLHDDSP